VVRFLPDSDPNNTFFWTERAMIKLPFNSIKGEPGSAPVIVQVPCMEIKKNKPPNNKYIKYIIHFSIVSVNFLYSVHSAIAYPILLEE
jgi:hypothetical protein